MTLELSMCLLFCVSDGSTPGLLAIGTYVNTTEQTQSLLARIPRWLARWSPVRVPTSQLTVGSQHGAHLASSLLLRCVTFTEIVGSYRVFRGMYMPAANK